MGIGKKAMGWGSLVLTLGWFYMLGNDKGAPETPAPEPSASAPAAATPVPHRMSIEETGGLLKAGAALGDRIGIMTRDDVCSTALENQKSFEQKEPSADEARCIRRHPELDTALLVAGRVVGPDLAGRLTKADICGLFGIAAMRTDLKDALAAGEALPAQSAIVDTINRTFQSCEGRHGKTWVVQGEKWENVSDALIFKTLYAPATRP